MADDHVPGTPRTADIQLPKTDTRTAQQRATDAFTGRGVSSSAPVPSAPAAAAPAKVSTSSVHDGINTLIHATPFGRAADMLDKAGKQ